MNNGGTLTEHSLIAVRVTSVGGRADAAWAEGLRFKVPADLPSRLNWRVTTSGELSLSGTSTAASPSDAAALRERAAFTDHPPVSSRLPISYQRIPGGVRAVLASVIGRWNRGRADRWAAFPGWPLDLSADLLSDLGPQRRPRAPGPAPVVLTHDIDSPEGLQNLVSRFLPLEESVGARSTSYIVPCAWNVDEGTVREVGGRGHDVGVHGYDHSNLTPFADAAERKRRLDAARPFAERVRQRRLSRAIAAAYASVAARSRRPLSLRQQHSDFGRPVSRAQQRLRDRASVYDRRHSRTAAVDAARRQPAVSRILAG